MAKKETVKTSKVDVINKIEHCIELAVPFVAAIAGEWGWDASAYTAAIAMALIDIAEIVKLFVKDK